MDDDALPTHPEEDLPAASVKGHGHSVALNTSAVAATQFGVLLIGLLLTPFILARLGLVLFGLWAFVNFTVNFLSNLDPGLGVIVIRYSSHDPSDRLLPARLSSLALGIWLGIGLLLSPLLVVVAPLLISSLHSVGGLPLPKSLVATAEWFFVWGYVQLFVTAGAANLGCRLIAAGEQWLVTLIGLLSRITWAVAVIGFLLTGWGLWGLALAASLQTAVVLTFTLVAIGVRHGRIFANPFGLGRTKLAEFMKFGGLVQLSSILDALNYDTDPIVVGRFVSVAASAIYQMANTAADKIAYLVNFPAQSLLQTFSATASSQRTVEDVRAPAIQASRYMGLFAFAASGALLAAGPSIMMLYFGPYHGGQYPGVAVALSLLVGLQLINAARYNCAIVIVALGKAGIGAKAKAISVVVNLGLTIALVFPFGLNGVLIGTMVASAVQNAFLMRRYTRLLNSSVRAVLWSWYLPGLFAMGVAVGCGRLSGLLFSTSPPVTRATALPVVLISLAGFSLVFALMLRAVRYLSAGDLSYFARILPGPLGKLPQLRVARVLIRTES